MKDKRDDFDKLLKLFDLKMKKFFKAAKRGRSQLAGVQGDVKQRMERIEQNKP